MIENYEQVREAIARWYGWEKGTDISGTWFEEGHKMRFTPDTLNNPCHAWALQCAIEDKGDVFAIQRKKTDNGKYQCDIFHVPIDEWISGIGATPEEALVNAWMAAFGGEV